MRDLKSRPVFCIVIVHQSNYYNTENWTALQVTYDEELGRILELTICDNFSFSQPLNNKIVIPREVKYVYLKVNIEKDKYYYFY